MVINIPKHNVLFESTQFDFAEAVEISTGGALMCIQLRAGYVIHINLDSREEASELMQEIAKAMENVQRSPWSWPDPCYLGKTEE